MDSMPGVTRTRWTWSAVIQLLKANLRPLASDAPWATR